MVVYDDFGLQTVFVMDPELIQAVLLDDVESFNKSPTMIACWARGRRGGFDWSAGGGNAGCLPRCFAPRRWRVAGDRPIGREQIQQLPLVEAIFSEEMRLYPPSLMRRAITYIEFGGHAIKPGVIIIIPIYVVHRHLLWNEPVRFDPARFSAKAKSRRHRCAYMPFGAGPRSCIGSTFAMLEGKAMLAMLLASARFELPEAELPEPLARITLRP